MAAAAPEIPVLARNQAFEALYRRHVKDVYYYALALLRNPADAEDVTQTTFMNAYRAYMRGDEILKPQNWLIKIAHNVARTRYARASRRVKEVPLEEHVEQLAVPEEDPPDVEGVLRALGRLPFNQRAALVMRELEGRSYVEIADTLGVSVPAVETLIFRARRSLRMRASALRSLAAVPLPTSLTQLFGGGGVVAGSGAVAGSGLLLKTAVALLAGAVVTGIGRDHTRPAEARARSQAPSVSSSGWSHAPEVVHGRQANARVTARATVKRPVAMARKRSGVTSAVTSTGARDATTSTRSASPVTVISAAQPMTGVVQTLKDAATGAAGSLPVQVPPAQLPPLPVEMPLPEVPSVELP
jgi:RNA polymerase sigma factor (sigma-70 family)